MLKVRFIKVGTFEDTILQANKVLTELGKNVVEVTTQTISDQLSFTIVHTDPELAKAAEKKQVDTAMLEEALKCMNHSIETSDIVPVAKFMAKFNKFQEEVNSGTR